MFFDFPPPAVALLLIFAPAVFVDPAVDVIASFVEEAEDAEEAID